MPRPVVHFEIMGKDGRRLADFYNKAFGWKAAYDEKMSYAMVQQKDVGAGIGGGIGTSQDGRPAVTVYVEVPDTDAALRDVERLGGRIVTPTMEIPGVVTFAQFADPAGNVVGLTKAMPAPAPRPRTRTARTTAKKRTAAKPKKKTTRRRA